jgi:hypothetical protein
MLRGSSASELGVDRFLARLIVYVDRDRNDAMKQSAEPKSPRSHLDTILALPQRT